MMIGKEPRALTAKRTPTPPQARESSSTTMQRFRMRSPPAPPYSFGIQTLKRPSFAMAFWSSQGYSWARSYFAATGRTDSSATLRARRRHSRFSGLSKPSMADSLLGRGDLRLRGAFHEARLLHEQVVGLAFLEELPEILVELPL